MPQLEDVLADTFLIEKRLPCPSGSHRRFAARFKSKDRHPNKLFVLSCAQYGTPVDAEVVERQRSLAKALSQPISPCLSTMIEGAFEPNHHWMASDLPGMGSLHDLLREHRKLDLELVDWVLQTLATCLTSATEKGCPRLVLEPHEIRLDLRARELKLILPDMPLFGQSVTAAVDPMQTMAFNPASLSNTQTPIPLHDREYVTQLAVCCCTMLGEEVAGGATGGNERFRPIAALSAHQNRVLRAALIGNDRHGFDSLLAFATEFTGIEVKRPIPVADSPSGTPSVSSGRPPSSFTQVTETQLALTAGYTLVDELRSTGSCRVWTARHDVHGEVVITSVDLSMEVAERARRLNTLMATLRKGDGKHWVAPLDIPASASELHVVRRKPTSTLLESLRRSKALEKPAVARVLASIHAAYEALWQVCGRRLVAMSLDQFWLVRDPDSENEGETGMRLDATQILLDHEFQPQAALRPIQHFARLTLHLLGHDGGPLTGGGSPKFTPIPELDPGTNAVLRSALDPSKATETSLNGFLAQMTAALAGHTAMAQIRKARALRVAPSFANRDPVRLSRVRLMPDVKDAPILTVVVDQQIQFGRTGANSDYVTQFLPRSPLNDSRTRSVSRVQLRAEAQAGQVSLTDVGETNPSMIKGEKITPGQVIDLPTTVLLGCEYPVHLERAGSPYSNSKSALKVEGWSDTDKPPTPAASTCIATPGTSGVLLMELAWLHHDVGLKVRQGSNRIQFCASDDGQCTARIHFHGGGLWLEAVSESTLVRLANVELRVGDFSPLQPEDVIGIQDRKLLVKEYRNEPLSS